MIKFKQLNKWMKETSFATYKALTIAPGLIFSVFSSLTSTDRMKYSRLSNFERTYLPATTKCAMLKWVYYIERDNKRLETLVSQLSATLLSSFYLRTRVVKLTCTFSLMDSLKPYIPLDQGFICLYGLYVNGVWAYITYFWTVASQLWPILKWLVGSRTSFKVCWVEEIKPFYIWTSMNHKAI